MNKLEANQIVYRVPDATDKRVMRVYLTPKGQEFAEQGEQLMISISDQLFTGFSEEELHTFITLVEKMKINIRSSDTKA